MDQTKTRESPWLTEHVGNRSGNAKNADVYMTNGSERWKIDVSMAEITYASKIEGMTALLATKLESKNLLLKTRSISRFLKSH
jgi:hypothetical protein